MKYGKILRSLFCVLVCFSLCACQSAAQPQKTRISVITKSTTSDFWHNVFSGVNSAATEYNAEVTISGPDSEEDYEEQNEMIYKSVSEGTDAIVLSAIDYENCATAVNFAVDSGVKVIMIDSDVDSDKTSLFIGTDSYEAGKSAGQASLDAFAKMNVSGNEKVNIGLVNYYAVTVNGQEREKGFRDAIASLDGVNIISSINVDSNMESAKNGAMQMLRDHPEINVLVGFNEWMTLGVGYAIRESGLSGSVCGVGFDSNVVSIGMLETGEMDALIVQNPFAMGYLAVKNACEILSGNQTEPRITTKAITVTRDNMFDKDIQKTLFHFN